MTAVHTTVHVGPDGILRLEMPINGRDCDVAVTVVVEDSLTGENTAGGPAEAPWAAYRQQLEAAGLRAPPPGSWSGRQTDPICIQGPAVAQTLVEDRR